MSMQNTALRAVRLWQKVSESLARKAVLGRLTRDVIPGAAGDVFVWQMLTALAIAALPLFHLTIKNWTNGWLVFLAVVSLAGLASTVKSWRALFPDGRSVAIVLALVWPLLAVIIALILRGEWVWNYLDGPSRLVLAAVAFLWLRSQRPEFLRAFAVVCPLSVWIAFCAVLLFPEPTRLWNGRFATYIADTNTFGMHIVLLGFYSFMMLQINPPGSWALRILQATSVGLAVYLSVGSQTRTGWLALPLLLAVWVYGMRGQLRKLTVTSAMAVFFAVGFFASYPPLQDRFHSIFSEYGDWASGENTDTSGGVRFALWQSAVELFKHRPLAGYGDYKQFKDYLELPAVRAVANDHALDTIRNGPHNEVLANALRSGIPGLLGALALYFLPLFVFWRGLKSTEGTAHLANLLGVSTVLAFMVFGVMFETFNLKFSASFYGFLIAVFAAQGSPANPARLR